MTRTAVAGLPLLVLLSGCSIDFEHDDNRVSKSMPVSIEAGKSDMARVELHMKVGDLNVGGGATHLVDGELRYLEPDKPTVQSNSSSFRATVSIDQVLSKRSNKGKAYRWDLKLNDSTPIDLTVDFGVGQGRLNLGSVDLRSLEVRMGVGELDVDLMGTPRHDYSVNIRGGVGHAKIYVPKTAGVILDAKGGIGGVDVRGLEKRDGRWVSDSYGKAKANIRLDVAGGVGEIEVIAQ